MAITKYRSSPEALDAAYNEWYDKNVRLSSYVSGWKLSYQSKYRLDMVSQRFERWVQEQGGVIRQENKRRFIEFDDETVRFQFVLTWCN